MADNNGLSFVSSIDNEQLNAALEETMRRVQGFSDGFVAAGDSVDQTVADIGKMLGQIGAACEVQENAIAQLETKLDQLKNLASEEWFKNGESDEYKALMDKQAAIQGEIKVREGLLDELREQSNKLDDARDALKREQQAAQENAQAHVSLKARIKELKLEMVEMEAAGLRNTDRYREIQAECANLVDAWGDAQAQATVLANDEAGFAGMMQGLGGLAGGFSAVTGVMGMFGAESENLQQIMLKTQSVMAVTNGLMQVAQTLNKDSAFMLGTVGKLKEWWNGLLEVGRAKQAEETVAVGANTVAQGANATAQGASAAANRANAAARGQSTTATTANTTATGANTIATGAQAAAATAGTAANITLAGAFRMVGAAIKSIPVFGWIIAGISAIIAAVSYFSSKAEEAKKKTEEFSKAIIEGCYKPIGKIQQLSAEWTALGDNMKAKEEFIRKNKKSFDDLGVAIDGVTSAENVLISNEKAFIDAQIAKAKALAYIEMGMAKVKEALQNREDANNVSLNWIEQIFSYGGAGEKMLNEKRTELNNAALGYESEAQQYFARAQECEAEGAQILQQANIKTQEVVAGSLQDLNDKIAEKRQELLKATDSKAYNKIMSEINALEKKANKITGGGGSSSSSRSTSDPFVEGLNKRKAEYQRYLKWMQSGDAVLVASAKKEFESLLKQGATYIDYLKTQRDQILQVDVAKRSKAQNHQLRILNNQIAEETKKTVLDTFNAELSEQLTNAKTTIEMLKVIEAKRKELANDGTELDNGKKESLDNAEKDVHKKEREELESLLNDYASYAEQKKRIEEQFNRDIETLNRARLAATTDAERQAIDDAIANRTKKKDTDVNNIGGVNYNDMLGEYGTFEQKKTQIHEEFEAKRRIAKEKNDTALINRLNEAEAKAISKLANEELTGSDTWSKLFGDLDSLTTTQIDTLINEIESKFDTLSGSFDPVDLAAIRDKLKEAKAIIIQDNPFAQVWTSIKAMFKDGAEDAGDSTKKIKTDWENLGKSTEASFKFISDAVNSCEPLKDCIGEIGSTALGSLTSICMASIAVAAAIKTAERASVILAIIQVVLVVIQSVYAVVKSIMGNNDKEVEEKIGNWKKSVDKLKNSYAELSWQIDKSLGGKTYEYQKKAIANMKEQEAMIKKMEDAEKGKKEKDDAKVEEYAEQQRELQRQIADMEQAIADDILQTTAKDFSQSLADALVSAFEKGEDAAKAFEQTVNDVLKQAIINQLKKKFLEQQLQGALKGLMDSMGHFQGDKFIFDGLTDAEIARFKTTVKNAGDNFNQAMQVCSGIFKDVAMDTADTAMSGAVKGVSEETASIVAGQMNAIRINQIESAEILRQQLTMLNSIATNTSFNRHLAKLDRIVSLLETKQTDTLRAQGLV